MNAELGSIDSEVAQIQYLLQVRYMVSRTLDFIDAHNIGLAKDELNNLFTALNLRIYEQKEVK